MTQSSPPAQTPTPAGLAKTAYLMLTISALCWGGNAVFGRLAVGEVSPMLLVTFRWLGVILLLLLFARRTISPHLPALRSRLGYVFLMGALGFTGFNSLFYVSAHSTTAVNIGIIQGSVPGMVILGAFLAYRSRVTSLQIAGVALAIIGVIVIASAGDLDRLISLTFHQGDLLMVLACVLYSGYTVGLRQKPAVPPLALFGAFSLAALVASLPGLIVEASTEHFLWPTSKGWVVILLVTLLPSFAAQVTYIRGVSLIGPGRASVFLNLVPVFASIFAVGFLQESFELFQATALFLVVGGIWLSERGKSA
ncbi:MAG: DMT family transporter [Pseudomonadota bacterium]